MSYSFAPDIQQLRNWSRLERLLAVESQKPILINMFPILFKRWADLDKFKKGALKNQNLKWKACNRLIDSALKYEEFILRPFFDLLQEYEKLIAPLEDPLKVNFHLHRWLYGCREEVYSDWLAWIFTELSTADRIGRVLFGNEIQEPLIECRDRCESDREVWVPKGHKGHSGRLDCVLRFSDKALIAIEVKVIEVETADIVKQAGYCEWLSHQLVPFKKAVLIATSGDESKDYYGFSLLTWRDLCIRLRKILPEIIKEGHLTNVSLILAFVGLVEQNILGIHFPYFHHARVEYPTINPAIKGMNYTA